MHEDLLKACEILRSESCTCVLCKFQTVYKSRLRGVAPLLQLLQEGSDFSGFSAADRVVGKAAAFLYCLLGVERVAAGVISHGALQVLQEHSVEVRYNVLTDRIMNRNRDGFCPMETAVSSTTDPQEALLCIRSTLDRLNQ